MNDANDLAEKVRKICARLKDVPPDSLEATLSHFELQSAAARLMAHQTAWSAASEPDKHQDDARQSYRSREADSADGFADGLKLFNSTKPGSDKKKD